MYVNGTIMENIVTIFLGKHVFRDSLSFEINQILNLYKNIAT